MNKTNEDTQGVRPVRGKTSSADLLGPNNEIARKLKQYYHELVSDEVPDRFKELLSHLEQAEPAGRLDTTAAGAEPGSPLETSETKAEG